MSYTAYTTTAQDSDLNTIQGFIHPDYWGDLEAVLDYFAERLDCESEEVTSAQEALSEANSKIASLEEELAEARARLQDLEG